MFVYYLLLYNIERLKNIAPQTAVPIINKEDFSDIHYFVPCNLEEQVFIVNRLKSLDTLISAEHKTVEKYRSIKLGLMKKLLTPPEGALEA